jgi:hypothetical protein
MSKAELLWKAHMFFNKDTAKKGLNTPLLISPGSREFKLPKLEHHILEDAYDEIELIGWPVSLTYFDLLRTSFRGDVRARSLMKYVGKKVRLVGNLVTIKYVRTVKREIMHFGSFLDVEGEFFDTVHFPDSLKAYPFRGYGVYLVLGQIVEEFGFPMVEVEKMAKLPLAEDPRAK